MGVTYDTGALMAAAQGLERMWARHEALLEIREIPTVPAPCIAKAWGGGSPPDQLALLLAGCRVEALDETNAGTVGALASRAGTTDVAAAFVVEGALRRGDLVVTSDPDELGILAASAGFWLEVDLP